MRDLCGAESVHPSDRKSPGSLYRRISEAGRVCDVGRRYGDHSGHDPGGFVFARCITEDFGKTASDSWRDPDRDSLFFLYFHWDDPVGYGEIYQLFCGGLCIRLFKFHDRGYGSGDLCEPRAGRICREDQRDLQCAGLFVSAGGVVFTGGTVGGFSNRGIVSADGDFIHCGIHSDRTIERGTEDRKLTKGLLQVISYRVCW